jgi:hypothetical protein
MPVKRYRKRPVVIEAIQWDGMKDTYTAICEFAVGHHFEDIWLTGQIEGTYGGKLAIQTLEGTMTADCGDWIIRGVQGEFYPCKPDIFKATYLEVIDGRT